MVLTLILTRTHCPLFPSPQLSPKLGDNWWRPKLSAQLVVVRGRRAICLLTYTRDKAMNYLHLLASILVERHDRNFWA